jgi:uncharacterized protein (UPF0276 family)
MTKYPIVCHGVELSLGSLDSLNEKYLQDLKELVLKTNSPWFSDHLCFSSNQKVHFHDLLPTLRSKESIQVISDKINTIQDFINKPFALENISYYIESPYHQMSEPEFIQEIVRQTGCYLLLDVNNVYVNAFNHGYAPLDFIRSLPLNQVIQIHLAGHFNRGDLLIDTHGAQVNKEVWKLFQETLQLLKRPVSTLIEWDNDIPPMSTLEEEVEKAKKIMRSVL